MLALLRMIELRSGTIIIDGIDLSKTPRHIIRSRLIVISQDPFFLSGSIRLNLDPYNAASDEDMTTALKKVELWEKFDAIKDCSPR